MIVVLRGDLDKAMLQDILPAAERDGGSESLTKSRKANGRYGIGPEPHFGWLILGSEADDVPEDVVWIRLSSDSEGVDPVRVALLGDGVKSGLDEAIGDVDVTQPIWIAGHWPAEVERLDGLTRIAGYLSPFEQSESRLTLTYADPRRADRAYKDFHKWCKARDLAGFEKMVAPQVTKGVLEFSARLGADTEQWMAAFVLAIQYYSGLALAETEASPESRDARN